MLKDTLLNRCNWQYKRSFPGLCDIFGSPCSNKEKCMHNCDACLDQVHWLQNGSGRRDYDCPLLLSKYVLRFTDRYSNQIHSALNNVDLSKYPEYDIFSIGCGGTPDLMAFEELSDKKKIYYKGYDRNPLWAQMHRIIEDYAADTNFAKVELQQEDIFQVFADGSPKHHQYNIVIMQYLISHLYNTEQNWKINSLFDYIISNVLPMRVKCSPFLIIITDIDSMNKGRNSWFLLLDKLENAGYYGAALARSAHPKGDLGQERWSNYRHKQTPVFGNITYNYSQNNSEHEGAQLIIELR